MKPPRKFDEQLELLLPTAGALQRASQAQAILLLLCGAVHWSKLRAEVGEVRVIAAADHADLLAGADAFQVTSLAVEASDQVTQERLAKAFVSAVASGLLRTGDRVVVIYSAFDSGSCDSVSVIDLGDHFGRLTVKDLSKIRSKSPLETVKLAFDLALEIGREGREGKPVGALLVVGDVRRVLKCSRPAGFDPVKGYSRRERDLKDPRVREAVKEIAQMDGAILIGADGVVEASARYLDAPASDITLSKGFGARHWAAAAISRATSALAICVSESSGTVRVFQNGEVVLRVEPFRRPMKWKDFDREDESSERAIPRPPASPRADDRQKSGGQKIDEIA